jgi:acetylornithine deacetylase/succinyl-diaminopimelate desuccinylase-like protein
MEIKMPDLEAALVYAKDHQTDFLEEFTSLLCIPSISTLPDHKEDMHQAADWIANRLQSSGFDSVAVMPTAGHPVVYGEWMKAGKDAPTILFYGHYDVQPPDPLELWISEPFEPEVRGEDLFARGASDMKGQIVAHLKAVEALLTTSSLPVNLKYLIEGEEEIGSPNLGSFISDKKNLLSCDLCLNGDSSILAPDVPAISISLRGLVYFEIRIQGAAGDLHSGTFGGAVDNPAIVLSKLIAGMRDDHGRITLPGFYDHVRSLSDTERAEMVSMPDEWWMEQSGASVLFGEEGYSPTERATVRPTLDVNGMISGFTGEGSKTVLPAQAMAKISMRLVPDQRPEMIKNSLEEYLNTYAPPTVTWELEAMASSPPAIVERDSSAVDTASRALEAVWGVKPVFQRQGGTVPVVGLVQELLGVDSLLLGFGLPDDNLHAPNEKMHLPNFRRGIDTYIHFMCEFGS